MLCLSAQGRWVSQPTTVLCITNLWAVCVRDVFHFDNPFLLSICLLFLFSLPPLRTSEGSFSFCTCSLLSPQLVLKYQTYLLSHCHLGRSFTALYFFAHSFHNLFHFPPFLPVWHTFIATLILNSTPYCPPARLFSPCQSHPSSRPLPPSFVSSLQGEPQWDWEAKAKQDDRLHHRIVRHGADLQRISTEARQTNNPANGCVTYEVTERKWQYQYRWIVQTVLPHWPGMSNIKREN